MVMTEPTGSFFPPRIFRVAVLISCKLPSSTRMMARQWPPAEDGKQAGKHWSDVTMQIGAECPPFTRMGWLVWQDSHRRVVGLNEVAMFTLASYRCL